MNHISRHSCIYSYKTDVFEFDWFTTLKNLVSDVLTLNYKSKIMKCIKLGQLLIFYNTMMIYNLKNYF